MSRLTDSIKQLAARRVLEENVLDGALRPLAEELEDVLVCEDLLDAHLLLDRRLRVGMLLQVHHLHRYRFARQSIYEQFDSAEDFSITSKKRRENLANLIELTRRKRLRRVSARNSNSRQTPGRRRFATLLFDLNFSPSRPSFLHPNLELFFFILRRIFLSSSSS